MTKSPYRGSLKHKKRPGLGRKGTLCPEWTHTTTAGPYGNDPFAHDWGDTLAHVLFAQSEPDPDGSGKRYATMRDIAFVAQSSADGTWHGYPEPWNKVPAELKAKWQDEGKVTARALRRYKDYPGDNITWALDGDDE